jgi:hypothetical protein
MSPRASSLCSNSLRIPLLAVLLLSAILSLAAADPPSTLCEQACGRTTMKTSSLYQELQEFNTAEQYNICAENQFYMPQLQVVTVVSPGLSGVVEVFGDCGRVASMNLTSNKQELLVGPSAVYTRNLAPMVGTFQNWLTQLNGEGENADGSFDLSFTQLNPDVASFAKETPLAYDFGTNLNNNQVSNSLSVLYLVLEEGDDALDVTLTVLERTSSTCASHDWRLSTGTQDQILASPPAAGATLLEAAPENNSTVSFTLQPTNANGQTWFKMAAGCSQDMIQLIVVHSKDEGNGDLWWILGVVIAGVVALTMTVAIVVYFVRRNRQRVYEDV